MSTEANKVPGMVKTMQVADTRRYVVLFQLILAIAIWWSLGQAMLLVWKAADWPRMEYFGGIHLASILAFIIAGSALTYTLRHPGAQDFANEVAIELRKVSWPSAKETRQSTMVVIICVVVVSLILGGFDLMWSKLIRSLLTYGTT